MMFGQILKSRTFFRHFQQD